MRRCVRCAATWVECDWVCARCGHAPKSADGVLRFAPELDSGTGYNDAFFSTLASLEAGHFWFEGRNALIIWSMRRFLPGCASFLEIGCGTGFVLRGLREAFPAMALSASEVSVAGLAFAKLRLRDGVYYQMDARNIPFECEFDGVGAFDVLEHVDDDERAMAETYRAIRPGGCFVVTVPQHGWLWTDVDARSHHVRRYSRRDLEGKLRGAGFEIAWSTSFMTLLLPLIVASRFAGVKPGGGCAVEGELRIGTMANRACAAAFAIERAAIRAGMTFPIGSSLLMVARRPR